MGSSLSSSQILGYLDACFGVEETGVHGDTLKLIAEGVVEIRDRQLASYTRYKPLTTLLLTLLLLLS